MPRLVINLRDTRPIWSIPDWALEELRAAAAANFEVQVVDSPSDSRGDGGAPSAEALEAVRGAEVHLGFGFPRALFQAATDGNGTLRWVHTATAGVGGTLYPEMRGSPILFTNSAGTHAEPIAESVLAAILYFARGIDLALAAQRERRWANDVFSALDSPVHEMDSTRLGILGLGGIGRELGRRAQTLGMEVIGMNRRGPSGSDAFEVVTGPSGLERIVRECRYIALCLPHTPSTDTILDRRAIESLRPDAVVINVGRGELIDEDALIEALRERRIRGAALDVFRTEPLPPDSALWSLPNVLITPHATATTQRFWRREVELIRENLERYLRGEPLRNTVDKEAGY